MLSLVATFAVAALPACGPVDLDTALALVVGRSDEMAIKRSELAAGQADVALAKAARWIPDANATIVLGPSPEARGQFPENPTAGSSRGLTGVGAFGRFELNVVQPLYTFGRLDAARDAANAGVEARTFAAEDTLAQLQLRVRKLFWGEALARKLLAIADDVAKAIEEVDKRIQDLLRNNDPSISTQDRYRVEVFRGVLKGRQAEARKGLDFAHIGLAATLGISPGRLEVVKVPLPVDLNGLGGGDLPDAKAARGSAEQRRPDLRALEQAIVAKRAQVEAEEGAAKPQFFIAGNFTYSRATNRDLQFNPWAYDPLNAFSFGAVLGLRQDLAFPLLGARAGKARAELATLEQQRAGLARLVESQVESALVDLKASRERLEAASAARDAGRALFRSSSLDFAVGLIEARPLLEAYAAYIENQVGLSQAAYDLLVARAQLAQVTGETPRKGAATCELY